MNASNASWTCRLTGANTRLHYFGLWTAWILSNFMLKYKLHSKINHYIIAAAVCQSNSSFNKRLWVSNYLIELCQGVLTKNKWKKEDKMSTWRQPSNPCLRLGLLGCHHVDIGMKLHLVHFAVNFSSAPAAPRLRRIWLYSAPQVQFHLKSD